MKNKIIISLMTVLLVALISLANIPTATAYVPTNPPDPPLDPAEVFFMDPGGMFSFNYGHSPFYGAYLRDFQWLSPGTGWDRYMGMLSVPYFWVNGVTYTFAFAGIIPPVPIGPSHWQIVYTYMLIMDAFGDTHNFQVIYDIWYTPPAPISPAPGTDLRIDVLITDNIVMGFPGGGPWTFNAPIRADFDIADLVSPNMDDAFVWNGAAWAVQWWEMTGPAAPPILVDPIYGMGVMQNDFVVSGVYPAGQWGGIVPSNANTDTYYILANNAPAPPPEYLGPPAGYMAPIQPIGSNPGAITTDVVIWEDMTMNIPVPPPPIPVPLNPQIWLR